MTTPKDRTQVSVTIKTPLAERLDAEADARVVGKSLLVEKALEFYFAALPPIEAPTRTIPDLPPGT